MNVRFFKGSAGTTEARRHGGAFVSKRFIEPQRTQRNAEKKGDKKFSFWRSWRPWRFNFFFPPRVGLRASVSPWLVVLITIGGLLTGGCANPDEIRANHAVGDYFAGDYAAAQRELRPLAAKTDGDFVLNNARLGSAALVNYDLDLAEAAFLRAYEVINSVGVNNGGRSIGAALVDEKINVWKGEPFERAMVNFYLGLVYYIRHDYGNARAAFENALFKLRDYGQGKDLDRYRNVESDFALAYLMLGRCYQRLGDDGMARNNFQRAVQLQPQLQDLADFDRNAQSNVLLVVDYGYGPQKVKEFDGSVIAFSPTPRQDGPIPDPIVIVDGRRIDLAQTNRPPVDLLALAQDRRWQSIDTLRTLKSVVGEGMIAVGGYEALKHKPNYEASLALIGVGLLLKASSDPDLRQWEMLPRTTFILPLHLEPGVHDITVDFPSGYRQTWQKLVAPAQGEATYYMRMQRWAEGPYLWPPPALATTPPQPISNIDGHASSGRY